MQMSSLAPDPGIAGVHSGSENCIHKLIESAPLPDAKCDTSAESNRRFRSGSSNR